MESASGSSAPSAAGLTHRKIVLVYCALALGMLLGGLDETIVATALPTIIGDVGGLDRLAWVVTAYIVAATISAPLYGKLGDLYGRKPLFQAAIAVFLLGSVLSGAAQTMTELIGFRAVQGLGAGGLIVGSQAITGDIVPARRRARFQGYIAATFAISSIAGPALGGLFVDTLSWRWIFYANLPLGALALLVVAVVLPPSAARRIPQRLDLAGAVLLTATVGPLTLALTLGGTQYAWHSDVILGLAAGGTAMLVLFVLQERRAAEPIVPLRLFGNAAFSAAAGAGFLTNLARWSVIVYLPLYLQVVNGVSPTASGVRLLPLSVGAVASSIVSGRAITRFGRYKPFTVAGTALVAIGLFLLSMLEVGTGEWVLWMAMAVLGIGLGLVMQVLVLAVQNAAERRDLGVATSTATFFRAIGGAIGVAIFGAVFANRLAYWLPQLLPHGAVPDGTETSLLHGSPRGLRALPSDVQNGVVEAFAHALHEVFLLAIPFAVLAFLVTLLAREVPLEDAEPGVFVAGDDLGPPVLKRARGVERRVSRSGPVP